MNYSRIFQLDRPIIVDILNGRLKRAQKEGGGGNVPEKRKKKIIRKKKEKEKGHHVK